MIDVVSLCFFLYLIALGKEWAVKIGNSVLFLAFRILYTLSHLCIDRISGLQSIIHGALSPVLNTLIGNSQLMTYTCTYLHAFIATYSSVSFLGLISSLLLDNDSL